MKLQRLRDAGIGGLALLAVPRAAGAGPLPYYRWSALPVAECSDVGGDHVELASQPHEWANLSATARIASHYILDGVDFQEPPFDPPDGTGSATYPGVVGGTGSYPFTFTLRLATLESGVSRYESALTAVCTGNGPTPPEIVDWMPGIGPAPRYRFAEAPDVTCVTNAGGVTLTFAERSVEWKNLPSSATYENLYSTNGTQLASGPFPLPEGDGSILLGGLARTAAAYPVHAAARLVTLIDGVPAHQSILLGACEEDGAGTSSVLDVPEPGAPLLALAALAALAVARRREPSPL